MKTRIWACNRAKSSAAFFASGDDICIVINLSSICEDSSAPRYKDARSYAVPKSLSSCRCFTIKSLSSLWSAGLLWRYCAVQKELRRAFDALARDFKDSILSLNKNDLKSFSCVIFKFLCAKYWLMARVIAVKLPLRNMPERVMTTVCSNVSILFTFIIYLTANAPADTPGQLPLPKPNQL
jgi:hypothetical protein